MVMINRKFQRRVSQVVSLAAPTGGINDLDPLASMGSEFCIDLENFYPQTGALVTRQGYREHATGLGKSVKTLMNYASQDGSIELFACTDDGIYDVTNSTDTPVKKFSISYGEVEWCMFSNIAGNFMVVTNGVDDAILYDGTTWKSFVETDTPTTPGDIKGVDPSTLTGVTSHKGRLWFVKQDSMQAFYMPFEAIAGEAKPFYLGGSLPRGGYLVEIVTWSLDSGSGMDDKLAFFSSQGEFLIYGGTDPADATKWQLESMFYISAPIGNSPTCELGGDVILMTRNGVIPLSSVVKGEASIAVSNSALSKRISRTLNRIVNSRFYTPNWEISNIPVLQAVLINIPATSDQPARQYVMNSLTGAWTRFTMPMRCTGLSGGKLYFGTTDGRVCLYGGVTRDDVKRDGTGGEEIICSMFSAYNYFGDPTTNKHYKLVRPIFQAVTPPGYKLRLNVDYDLTALGGNPPVPGPEGDQYLWNAINSLWDQAFWASQGTTYFPWTGVTGLGFCAALLMKVNSSETANFAAMEVVFEAGGSI
jgi:hypothetical protein